MCLAIPGKIIDCPEQTAGLRTGVVSFDGVKKTICLEFVPEARSGMYVIVHAGFALAILDEHEAQTTLELLGKKP